MINIFGLVGVIIIDNNMYLYILYAFTHSVFLHLLVIMTILYLMYF